MDAMGDEHTRRRGTRLPDAVEEALATVRFARLTPTQLRRAAAALRRLADDLDRRATAEERVGHLVRTATPSSSPAPAPARGRGGRPRGTGARFLRWEPNRDRPGGRLHIGRALWDALGRPARLNVERSGDTLRLTIAEPGAGWAVIQPGPGMPRLSIGEDAATALRLVDGRWDAAIVGQAIVASMP